MDHEPVLITTIAVGLMAAFIGGFVAKRLGFPAIVGYILAGVVIGPFTPGFVADPTIAFELAEIGIILLMFGVGIEFSIRDLMSVRNIAIPGALGQILVATILGILLGFALGWEFGGGLVLGLSLSVASTVVLLRVITDRGELDTPQGRIAVGWLIVEDLVTVVILVLLPTLAPLLGGTGDATADGLQRFIDVSAALGKAALFAVVMVVAGARLVPRLLALVANEGSKELFTLAVLALALGLAWLASEVFGVSFALGAFLAGAVVSESDTSHQALADALPLRDAFAVLFFVSIGMLLDPAALAAMPLAVAAVVAVIVLGKGLFKFAFVLIYGYPVRVALSVGAGLAQIGEFSFILATVGVSLALLPAEGFQLIVAGALFSIALTPFLFRLIDPLEARIAHSRAMGRWLRIRAADLATLPGASGAGPGTHAGEPDGRPLRLHAILCGYGRVGTMVGRALERRGFMFVVISTQRHEIQQLRARGIPALYGEATNVELLHQAQIETARLVIIAGGDAHAAHLIVDRARVLNPAVDFVVRTASDDEIAQLRALSPRVQAVHAQRELAVQMARYSLRRFGVNAAEAEAVAQGLRGRPFAPPPAPRSPTPFDRMRARVRRTAASAGGAEPAADSEEADRHQPS